MLLLEGLVLGLAHHCVHGRRRSAPCPFHGRWCCSISGMGNWQGCYAGCMRVESRRGTGVCCGAAAGSGRLAGVFCRALGDPHVCGHRSAVCGRWIEEVFFAPRALPSPQWPGSVVSGPVVVVRMRRAVDRRVRGSAIWFCTSLTEALESSPSTGSPESVRLACSRPCMRDSVVADGGCTRRYGYSLADRANRWR